MALARLSRNAVVGSLSRAVEQGGAPDLRESAGGERDRSEPEALIREKPKNNAVKLVIPFYDVVGAFLPKI